MLLGNLFRQSAQVAEVGWIATPKPATLGARGLIEAGVPSTYNRRYQWM
jgi:hypothetical protein